MQIFGFNTGRAYTSEGQLITVGFECTNPDDLVVYFNDHSRCISGQIKETTVRDNNWYRPFLPDDQDLVRMAKRVLNAYDNDSYVFSTLADQLKAKEFIKL